VLRGSKKGGERTTFNDEEERRRQVAQQRADEIEARKKEAYNELRYTTNKVSSGGEALGGVAVMTGRDCLYYGCAEIVAFWVPRLRRCATRNCCGSR
jgi:hypothetical protein